ncbi:MAG TPA: toxin-antitoxin system toxin subunit [Proteobacteria bacterium]|nr:toxin-antitoxin system toxin subunit [Pseudomonadota bacterium]
MTILSEILSSRARAEIFRILFSGANSELHAREIQRRAGMSIAAVQDELKKLDRLNLINTRPSGNRVYYRSNQEHPLYREIYNLVLKTSGLADLFKEAFEDTRIRIAFIFGSIADGKEKPGSDVDLIVIGNLGLRELSGLLAGLAEKIGREINPHVFSQDEFSQRLNQVDPFLNRVISSPKLFIKGTEDDLRTMGE